MRNNEFYFRDGRNARHHPKFSGICRTMMIKYFPKIKNQGGTILQ